MIFLDVAFTFINKNVISKQYDKRKIFCVCENAAIRLVYLKKCCLSNLPTEDHIDAVVTISSFLCF